MQVEHLKDASSAVSAGIECALARGLAVEGIKVVVVRGVEGLAVAADKHPAVTVEHLGEALRVTWMQLLYRHAIPEPAERHCAHTANCP